MKLLTTVVQRFPRQQRIPLSTRRNLRLASETSKERQTHKKSFHFFLLKIKPIPVIEFVNHTNSICQPLLLPRASSCIHSTPLGSLEAPARATGAIPRHICATFPLISTDHNVLFHLALRVDMPEFRWVHSSSAEDY